MFYKYFAKNTKEKDKILNKLLQQGYIAFAEVYEQNKGYKSWYIITRKV